MMELLQKLQRDVRPGEPLGGSGAFETPRRPGAWYHRSRLRTIRVRASDVGSPRPGVVIVGARRPSSVEGRTSRAVLTSQHISSPCWLCRSCQQGERICTGVEGAQQVGAVATGMTGRLNVASSVGRLRRPGVPVVKAQTARSDRPRLSGSVASMRGGPQGRACGPAPSCFAVEAGTTRCAGPVSLIRSVVGL